MKFKICYRTPFRKECIYLIADTLKDALEKFNIEVTQKRKPIKVYIDYVWSCRMDTNEPIYRFI